MERGGLLRRCTDQCPTMPVNSPQCHCTGCHLTFGGPTAFDLHRFEGGCRDITSFGYEEMKGIWRQPMDNAKVAAFVERVRGTRGKRDDNDSPMLAVQEEIRDPV